MEEIGNATGCVEMGETIVTISGLDEFCTNSGLGE